jgi:hypothetical protein
MKTEPVHVITEEKLLQYNLSVQIYNADTQLPVMEFCNGFSVRNIAPAGGATVVIMGDPLIPGQVKNVGGNRGEIYVGRLDLKFTGGGVQSCLVTQKIYTNIPRENEKRPSGL